MTSPVALCLRGIAASVAALLATPLPAQTQALLDSAATLAPAELRVEQPQFLRWLDTHLDSLSPDALPAVREHLYFLIGSIAQLQYRVTGNVFPPRDTLGLVDLLDRGSRLGIPGAGLIAHTLDGANGQLATPIVPDKPLSLAFTPPSYVLRSESGWSIRFPYYFMIGGAYYGVPSNGIGTETVMLSTLFAKHRHSPGHSQATVLFLATQNPDTSTFYRFWLDALGLRASDRVSASLLSNAQTYRAFDTDTAMNKEVVTLVRDRTAFVIAFVGLPGPYESNRPDFVSLLNSLTISAPHP